MGSIRTYIKPYNQDGTYQSDYIDVTPDTDMQSISNVSKQLDNSDFDVGVFSTDSLSLRLNNQSGMYNDVGDIASIFKYRRAGSLVKITWLFGESEPICGLAICGEAVLGPEETIFEGILSDTASSQNIKDQKISFAILGKESVFSAVEAPFSSFTNGDLVSAIIYDCLNQAEITKLVSVDALNINPSNDFDVDDVSKLENKTVKEVLDDMLAASNSILQIVDDIIIVSSRDESATLMKTFYGQASPRGVEDVINIKNIVNGLSRMFDFWTWQDTTLVSKNTSSITSYGVKKKEISYDFVTNSTTQQGILDALKTEFGGPKQELQLTTYLTMDTLALNLLDKVAIDYPTNTIAVGDELLPIIGIVKVGEFVVPFSEFSLTLSSTDYFKIISKDVDIVKEEITFKLRRI